jgi:23S rRNA pseudouridine1911/1915/1917 synthase
LGLFQHEFKKMNIKGTISIIADGLEKSRLDHVLMHALRQDYSRAFCQKLIKDGFVRRDESVLYRSSELIAPGTKLAVFVPQRQDIVAKPDILAQEFTVEVIYENEHFAIINKPAGLLVHAAATAPGELTLVDWIRQRFPDSTWDETCMRPGIIHRLDRDTSGLMVVVKTPQAQMRFAVLFKSRSIAKCYHAVVQGTPLQSGTIDWNIVRHPRNRILMTHSRTKGREALTNYKVLEYFNHATLIEALPETGRTHQIRVHCAAMGRPIIGDALYHQPSALIKRQALHAVGLSFVYDDQHYEFHSDYPEDIKNLLAVLRVDPT